VQRWLGELALALRQEAYRPDPIRRVFIPKANGKLRPLGISTLRDRVCMTVAMLYACFYVPRFRPDGSKNAVLVQRLKDKVGNRSNSSGEAEFQDAYGLLMGEEGRGIPTVIEMATYTRLNCVLGSAALLRQALVQALSYTRQRRAFGKKLIEHGLMRAVLVDLALESEAALALGMRLAEAFEQDADDRHLAWKRIMTPAAKFWVCKRSVELTGEAMEVLGGNGYVNQGIVARLFKEAPVNFRYGRARETSCVWTW